MTCIVGLVGDDGKIYMGGDSAVTAYITQTLAFKKVFRHRDALLGYSGSLRMCNLLQHSFSMPEHPADMSTERYLVTLFVDSIRTLLKDAGNATKQNEQESGTGYFLIGYQSRLFEISFDYSLTEVTEGYAAIGSGNEVALGAMYATSDMSLIPQKRITLALEAAAHYCRGVRGPFTLEVLEPIAVAVGG